MNKIKSLMLSAPAAVLGFMSFASAQLGFFGTRSVTEGIIQFYKDFFGPIFAALFGQYNTDDFLFAKVLLFILLLMVISFVLEKSKLFGKKKGVNFLASGIISLLALRYIPENDLINGILLPYGVLGVALMTFLPFLIYFFFVHESVPGGFGRRAAWAVYGIIFLVLMGLRWTDISAASEWIYLIGILLVILAFIFDKTIHGYFVLGEIEKIKKNVQDRSVVNLLSDYKKAVEVGRMDVAKKLEDQLKNLGYMV